MAGARRDDGGLAALRLRAPAKVNLFLEVVGRRADGFHAIQTLMLAVSLADDLEFAPADREIDLTCSDPALGTGPENLVRRAAESLRRRTGCLHGARIRLTKRIPMQGGLGGGSSDAAATLLGLNRLWGLNLGVDELNRLAADLGSDVPFFLHPPAAWCTGRGEDVSSRPLGGPLHLVLIAPPFGLPTADVYRAVQVPDQPADGSPMLAALAAGDAPAIGRLLHNRLQEAAERLRPELTELRARLDKTRPLGSMVSGSGSTIFAVARDAADARRIEVEFAAGAPADGTRTFVVRSEE